MTSSDSSAAAHPVLDVTDADFARLVLEQPGAVLLDVWAPWCGPCRLMAPLMSRIASDYAGRLSVAKLEADGNPLSRDQLGIAGLPTLILFRGGEELARHEGAMALPQLTAFLDARL